MLTMKRIAIVMFESFFRFRIRLALDSSSGMLRLLKGKKSLQKFIRGEEDCTLRHIHNQSWSQPPDHTDETDKFNELLTNYKETDLLNAIYSWKFYTWWKIIYSRWAMQGQSIPVEAFQTFFLAYFIECLNHIFVWAQRSWSLCLHSCLYNIKGSGKQSSSRTSYSSTN